MPIGDLNKQVTLQYQTRVADGMGGWTITWNDADTVWAAIWPVSAIERISAEQTHGMITHRIRIRYRRNVRTSWRVKFGERYFNINGPPINPNERNEWLDLMCTEAA